MLNFIKNFRNDEDGAVTVDWVVLTAAIVGLAIVAGATIMNATTGVVDNVTTGINSAQTATTNMTAASGGSLTVTPN